MPLLSDIRLAVRSLRRRPAFAALSLTTIALAIGANVAIFSVIDAILLRPLPFIDPGRQVVIESRAPTGFLVSNSIPDIRDWRDRSEVFESYAAEAGWDFTLTGQGSPQALRGAAILGDFFGTLGLEPVAGRVITAEEAPDHPGGGAVVVLGHSFALERFGSAEGAVAQSIRLDGQPYTVVGVLPPDLGFPGPQVQVYCPMATIPDLPWTDRDAGFGTRSLARLRPGVSLEAARLDLERVGRQMASDVSPTVAQPVLQSLSHFFVGDIRGQLWILMGAVACVLLIAVTNIGSLLVARGEDRHRELAIRVALGADRGTLLRLLLTEALVLAGLGGIFGIVAARLALGGLVALLPAEMPQLLVGRIHLSGTVILVGVGLALAVGAIFGLLPALRVIGSNLTSTFRSGGRTSTGQKQRLLGGLVVIEVAVAIVLLAGGGLMIRSFSRLSQVDLGFSRAPVLSAAPQPSDARIPNRDAWYGFYHTLRERAAGLPGVRSAALALLVPLSHRSWERGIWPEGTPVEDATAQSVLFNVVSPEYFATLGVPLLRGRGFEETDRNGAPAVAVIDETMAERFWPGQDPIGKRVTLEKDSGGTAIYRTVVGVTRNVRHYEMVSPSRIQVYIPFAQTGARWGMHLRLMVTGDHPLGAVAPLRKLLTEMDPDAPLSEVTEVGTLVNAALAPSRALTGVLSLFGLTALALAALGIFGVMSFLVLRRTREIGIRMALGATQGEILRWVGRRAARLTALGFLMGLLGAFASTRLLRQVLYEVDPLDPITLATVVATLALAAVLAAWLPARRAAGVDPAIVLSEEG